MNRAELLRLHQLLGDLEIYLRGQYEPDDLDAIHTVAELVEGAVRRL